MNLFSQCHPIQPLLAFYYLQPITHLLMDFLAFFPGCFHAARPIHFSLPDLEESPQNMCGTWYRGQPKELDNRSEIMQYMYVCSV